MSQENPFNAVLESIMSNLWWQAKRNGKFTFDVPLDVWNYHRQFCKAAGSRPGLYNGLKVTVQAEPPEPHLIDRYRQTGRTTRLLNRAFDLIGDESVLIITHNEDYAETLRKKIKDRCGHETAYNQILVKPESQFDWVAWKVPGYVGHVLVDNGALEGGWRLRIIEEWLGQLARFHQP